jgi:hypothetical protein
MRTTDDRCVLRRRSYQMRSVVRTMMRAVFTEMNMLRIECVRRRPIWVMEAMIIKMMMTACRGVAERVKCQLAAGRRTAGVAARDVPAVGVAGHGFPSLSPEQPQCTTPA